MKANTHIIKAIVFILILLLIFTEIAIHSTNNHLIVFAGLFTILASAMIGTLAIISTW